MARRIAVTSGALLLSLAATGSPALAQIGQARGGCDEFTQPGPEEVIIYVDADFRGDCRILSKGVYPTPAEFGLPNDSISSFKAGTDVQAQFVYDHQFITPDHPFLGLDCVLRRGNQENRNLTSELNLCSNARHGWNDKTSSIRVVPMSGLCRNPGPGQVVLFQQSDFNIGDCITKDVGAYNVLEIGIRNDSVSSIKVGPGTTQVFICRHGDFLECDLLNTGTFLRTLNGTRTGDNNLSSIWVLP